MRTAQLSQLFSRVSSVSGSPMIFGRTRSLNNVATQKLTTEDEEALFARDRDEGAYQVMAP